MICVWIVGFLSLTLGGIVRGAESLEKEPLRHGKSKQKNMITVTKFEFQRVEITPKKDEKCDLK